MLKTMTCDQYITARIIEKIIDLSNISMMASVWGTPDIIKELEHLIERYKSDENPGYLIAEAMIKAIQENNH